MEGQQDLPGSSAVWVRDLAKTFAGDIRAVDRLNLDVSQGEIFGLVGPDGAGKTTALRMIAGLSRADSGRIRILDQEVANRMSVASQIGYMPQRFGLYSDLTISENLAFFGELRELTPEAFRLRSAKLLKMTRLEPFLARPAGKLSGGMKQKLALCCSLLHEPAVLLLDEPTNGVDPVSRRDFWKLLHGLSLRGLTIVLATAYLDEAERCNRVGLMSGGKIIAEGRPDQLVDRHASRCYQVRGAPQSNLETTLQSIPECIPVASGEQLLVFVPPERGKDWLVSQLEKLGLQGTQLEASRPSLEDIFILLSLEEKQHAGV